MSDMKANLTRDYCYSTPRAGAKDIPRLAGGDPPDPRPPEERGCANNNVVDFGLGNNDMLLNMDGVPPPALLLGAFDNASKSEDEEWKDSDKKYIFHEEVS